MDRSSIISIITFALTILGRYFLNRKAGEKGWYALIPFYSTYLTYKYANRPKSYFIVLITSTAGLCLLIFSSILFLYAGIAYIQGEEVITTYSNTPLLLQLFESINTKTLLIMFAASLVLLIIALIFKFKQCRGLALNFNASKGFAWILLIFGLIGTLILAFDEEYQYQPLITKEEHNPYYDE